MRRRIVGLVAALTIALTGFAVGSAVADTPQGAGPCWRDNGARVSEWVGMEQAKGRLVLYGTCYGIGGRHKTFEMTVPAGPWMDYFWQQADFYHSFFTSTTSTTTTLAP